MADWLKNKFSFLKALSFINIINFFKIYKAPFFSGGLFGFGFIPFPFFTWFFALVPLWLFIYRQNSLKRVLIGCIICQTVTTFIGFNWMIYTFHNFGQMSWLLSALCLILFCFLASSYIAFAGCLWFLLAKKASFPLPVFVKLALLPLIFSILHSLTPTVFPWNMGYPWLWGGLPGAQTAELWGFRFLNTLFYIFNLLFLIICAHTSFLKAEAKGGFRLSLPLACRIDSAGKKALALAFVLFICLNLLGFFLKRRLPQPDRLLNVILIQNNIGAIAHLNQRSLKRARKKALRVLKSLTYQAVFKHARSQEERKNIDFIIWSEGSYGYVIDKKRKTEPPLTKIAQRLKIPLITGASSQLNNKYSNSLVVFDRGGNILKPIYDKIKLVIFGEYFPWIDRFPILRKMFPYFSSNLTPGKEIQTQELEGARLGWQICYEALFDEISRRQAQQQAQILVNITNDHWYGPWQEPYQHLTIGFARAIEVRRPLVRSANTGYSGVIRANGEVDKISPLHKPWFHLYKVPYYKNPPKTLFMSWGYYINEMFLFCLALLVCAGAIRARGFSKL